MLRFIKFPATCLLLITASGFTLSAKAEILEAQWQAHQVRFRFVGLSTAYTCDSIERKLMRLLRLLGARDDVRAQTSCTSGSSINRIHRVKLAFAMPVLADKTDISREIIPAEWQDVKVVSRLSGYLDPGDCELLEQFDRQVLSLLQVRIRKKRIRCIPYRGDFNSVSLKLTALKAPRLQVRAEVKKLHCQHHHREYDPMRNYRSLRVRMTALQALEKTDLEPGRNQDN